jgi:heptosyltransferase-2
VDSRAPEKILVRAPSWVGDLVMATPALRALRLAHPRAEIVLEGRRFLEGLVEGLPSIDRFMADPGRGFRPLLGHARALRSAGFDWAILLPDSVRAALGPFLARIPVRAGYARDLARRALLTLRLDPPRERGRRLPVSMIERYLCITRALGCADRGDALELPVQDSARARMAERLEASGIASSEPVLLVTPGASFGSSKLWPLEHFARACDGIARDRGLRTLLAPGPGEEAIAAAIADGMETPAVNLADPPTTLAELVALVERARLVLTNDTGPRHIAVALGCPVVTLMGPTDPRHTAHLLERQRVLRAQVDCSPCHHKTCPIDHRCMTRLTPDRAVAAAKDLLA